MRYLLKVLIDLFYFDVNLSDSDAMEKIYEIIFCCMGFNGFGALCRPDPGRICCSLLY